MNRRRALAIGVVGLCTGLGWGLAQSVPGASRDIGPDLIVSDLYEPFHWGASPDGTIRAYSIGTWACNIGDQPAVWYSNTDQHPLIGQNMFRLSGGRYEQVGQSWLKWGYLAENTNNCGDCVDPGAPGLLGVNCADSYAATWNGYQGALGPKSVVNPFTGAFPATHATPPTTTIGGRLDVHSTDINTPGTAYFVEGQYVSPDDSAAGNNLNNTSYRQVWFRPDHSLTFISPGGTPSATVQQEPGIAAWAEQDAAVFLASADVPGDGRLYVARKPTDLGGGAWHYEIAIQNVNSDRAVGGVVVHLPAGANASNLGFHAVEYHSGEIYDGTPWTGAVTPAGVHWDTVDYATNQNANALRWGTLYNFWFDADVPPEEVALAELRLFKPGSPASIAVAIGPISVLPGDLNCDGVVDLGDINPFVLHLSNFAAWQATYPDCDPHNGDINGDGTFGQGSFEDINPFVALLSGGGYP